MTHETDKRAFVEKRLTELNKERMVICARIGQELNAVNRLRLQQQADNLAEEILAMESQLRQIDTSNETNRSDAATYNITITGGQGFVIGNQAMVTQHFSAGDSGSEPTVPPLNSAQLVTLADLTSRYFNLADVRDLCFRLGIDYEDVAGAGKSDKIRELVLMVERNGRSPELITLLKQLRPHVNWD